MSLTELPGEYWITPDAVIYCDGDAGADVPNHDMVVQAHLFGQFADRVANIPALRWLYLGEDTVALADDYSYFRQQIDSWTDDAVSAGLLTAEQSHDVFSYIQSLVGFTDEEMSVLTGCGDVCPRGWATKHLGWIRVRSTACEMFTITASKLKLLADGLYDAHDSLCESAIYFLENTANNTWYFDVPYEAIASERPTALYPYRNARHANRSV